MATPPFKKSRLLPPADLTKVVQILGQGTYYEGGYRGAQWTASEGHPWHMKPRPQGDIGGDFSSVKFTIDDYSRYHLLGAYGSSIDGPIWPFENPGLRFSYTGPDPSSPSGIRLNGFFPDPSSSETFLKSQGTVAVDRCSPVNSIASVATTLGELKRDGIPALPGLQTWRDKTLSAKNGGNEYLNVQFGWAPLISDIKKFAQAASQSSKILRQLERDSGRQVRRRYEFPIERKAEHAESGVLSGVSPNPSYMWGGNAGSGSALGGRFTEVVTTTRRWFSGAFTYYLPTGGTAFDRVAKGFLEFEKLFGISPDPETIWNLTPWSWATDWALNTGSVLSNLTDAAQYGLVMPYGYIMEETSVEYNVRIEGVYDRAGYPVRCPTRMTHTVKRRHKASPFGFGLTWEGFDAYQLSILAALGITRNPHH